MKKVKKTKIMPITDTPHILMLNIEEINMEWEFAHKLRTRVN